MFLVYSVCASMLLLLTESNIEPSAELAKQEGDRNTWTNYQQNCGGMIGVNAENDVELNAIQVSILSGVANQVI